MRNNRLPARMTAFERIQTIFFILLAPMLWAQTVDTHLLTGKIMLDGLAVDKVNVSNSNTGKATVSDESGMFTIPVITGDALIFSAINLETKRRVIVSEDLLQVQLLIVMSERMTPLQEVTVYENSAITAEKLGIIPYGQKKYSPAERRVNEATTGSGIVPLNPILNALSGRTAMLKKEVIAEKKEKLLLQLDGWFEQEFYISSLKVPRENIRGFHYFLIEDVDFVRALKARNKTLTRFLVKPLALQYINTLPAQ